MSDKQTMYAAEIIKATCEYQRNQAEIDVNLSIMTEIEDDDERGKYYRKLKYRTSDLEHTNKILKTYIKYLRKLQNSNIVV